MPVTLRAFIDFDEPFAGRQTLCRCWGEIRLDADEALLAALGLISAEVAPAFPLRGLPAMVSHDVFGATHLKVGREATEHRGISESAAADLVDKGASWVTYDWSGHWAESPDRASSHVRDIATSGHSWLDERDVGVLMRFLRDRKARRLRVHQEDLDTIRAILPVAQRDAIRALFIPGGLVEIEIGFPGAWPTFALDAASSAMSTLEATGRQARLVYWACSDPSDAA